MGELPAAIAIFVLMVCVCGGAAEDCTFASLFKHLNLSSSNDLQAHIRPVRNWMNLTVVKVNFVVYGITEVNEKAQTFTSQTWQSLYWANEFLRWDPARFCGIYYLEVPRKMVWYPDIMVQEDTSDLGSTISGRNLMLYANGDFVDSAIRQLKATCQMDLFYFPGDVQRCNITFGSFSTHGTKVSKWNDGSLLTELSEEHMTTNGEWEMTNISVVNILMNYDGQDMDRLIYQVTLTRRPMLYIINCILPLFFFLVLDMGTFFISEARGEKLSLKVTLLLSISVLLLIVQDILPSTSDKLPLIALYSIVVFSLMAISLMEAMLVSFLLDKDNRSAKPGPAPSCIVAEPQIEAPQSEPIEEKPKEGEKETEGHTDIFLLKLLLEEVKSVRQEVLLEDSPADKKLGFYSRLAVKIDVTFFWVYLISNVGFLIYVCKMWMGA